MQTDLKIFKQTPNGETSGIMLFIALECIKNNKSKKKQATREIKKKKKTKCGKKQQKQEQVLVGI